MLLNNMERSFPAIAELLARNLTLRRRFILRIVHAVCQYAGHKYDNATTIKLLT